MIKSKKQGVVFGLIMSYAMAIGMEVYNVAIKQGGLDSMTNSVFPAALKEAAYMGLIVFVFSNLWGNRAGAAFAARVCSIERDHAYFCRRSVQSLAFRQTFPLKGRRICAVFSRTLFSLKLMCGCRAFSLLTGA